MNNSNKKSILRYAAIIAKGDNITDQEKAELVSIEDQLKLTREAILREATSIALSNIR